MKKKDCELLKKIYLEKIKRPKLAKEMGITVGELWELEKTATKKLITEALRDKQK